MGGGIQTSAIAEMIVEGDLPLVDGKVYLVEDLIPVDEAVDRYDAKPIQGDLFGDLCDGVYCGT